MSDYSADFLIEAHFYANAMESGVVFFTVKVFSFCDLTDVQIVPGSLSALWDPAEFGNMPTSETILARFYCFYIGGCGFL